MRILALFAALTLCACASTYGDGTQSITGGFFQRQVGENVWQVEYSGNAYTTDETVQTYWLYRAAELTLEQGYDGFRINSRVELTRGPARVQPAQYRAGDAQLTRIVERGLDGKPFMVATITLLRAPLPDEPRRVFEARALRSFLDPLVNGEKCGGNVCPHVHRYLFPGFAADPGAPT